MALCSGYILFIHIHISIVLRVEVLRCPHTLINTIILLIYQGYPLSVVLLLLAGHCHLSCLHSRCLKQDSNVTSDNSESKSKLLLSMVYDEFSILKLTSTILIALACLSKGAATSICGCFAVVEYIFYIDKDESNEVKIVNDDGKRKSKNNSTVVKKQLWVIVLKAVSHQIPSLLVSLFVAKRTMTATAEQV